MKNRNVIIVHDPDIELVIVAGIPAQCMLCHDGTEHLLVICLYEYAMIHVSVPRRYRNGLPRVCGAIHIPGAAVQDYQSHGKPV
jgi:hypothetical protein